MKASAAVVAVTASASAQTLTRPLSFVDESISAGPLSAPNAATPVFTQSSNMTSTSASTWVASPALRLLEWATILRKDGSTSDLEPAAAAATTNQMTTTILTRDVSVVPTVKKRGEPDIEEKLRSIFGDRRGGPSGSSTSTSTSSVHPEEHTTADPAATLRIQEHQDVLQTMTKATRTTQGEKSCVTPNPAGTMRAEEVLDILQTVSLRTESTDEEQQTKGEPNIRPSISRAWMEIERTRQQRLRARMTTTQSRNLDVPITCDADVGR